MSIYRKSLPQFQSLTDLSISNPWASGRSQTPICFKWKKVNVAGLSAVILMHAWIMEGYTNEMIVQQSPNEQKRLKGSHTRK